MGQAAGFASIASIVLGVGFSAYGLHVFVFPEGRRRDVVLALAFAALLLPVSVGLVGVAAGQVETFGEVVKLGAAVTPQDMASGTRGALASGLWGAAAAIAGFTFVLMGYARISTGDGPQKLPGLKNSAAEGGRDPGNGSF